MSSTRVPWAEHMNAEQKQQIRAEDDLVRWLQDRIVLAKARRQKLINAATQRARLEAKRDRPARAYRSKNGI